MEQQLPRDERKARANNWKNKTSKNSKSTQELAEAIVTSCNPPIDEKACINYALEYGYTRADGQKAWQIIFREMKSM